MSIYDEDINSDDHVDDVYADEQLSPGGSISEVSNNAALSLGESAVKIPTGL